MLYFDFPVGWYLMAIFGLIVFTIATIMRKSTKGVLQIGSVGLAFSVIVEMIGIYLSLWNYPSGNWPAILWPLYALLFMIVYQITKVAEQKKLLQFRKF